MRLDLAELTALRDLGYLRMVPHPEGFDLTLLNYTPKAQYDDLWGDHPALLDCRGTIIRGDGSVVAKPLKKFWGIGQRPELSIARLATLGTPEVAHKLDGSLATLFPLPGGGHALATRGSFTSPQARAATRLWRERYAGVALDPLLTYVFEYVAPDNRIVVAYPTPQLVLIGCVETATGREAPYGAVRALAWRLGLLAVPHEPVAIEGTTPWTQLLTEERANFEGYVLYWPAHGVRVKAKLAEYVRLHRLITGLSERTVWEALRAGADLGAMRRELPEETRPWFDTCADGLMRAFAELHVAAGCAVIAAQGATTGADARARRKAQAQLIVAATAGQPAVRAAAFQLLDGKPGDDVLWKALEPRGPAVTRWQSMTDEEEAG